MNHPLQLTFGVELECLVKYDPSKYESDVATLNCSPRTSREERFEIAVRRDIRSALQSIGIPVNQNQESARVQKWSITSDDSIEYYDEHNCVDVEIKSPAYNYSERALAQVKKAIEQILNHFDVKVNKSCGFHVHVGNQRKGFPLQTLKQFCILTTVLEPHFNCLHPYERVSGLGSTFARGSTELFLGTNPWDISLLIQGMQSHTELVKRYAKAGIRWDRFQAYNLIPLVDDPKYQTIEFRQHEATTDPTAIRKWIKLACGLVMNAHNIAKEQLTNLIWEFAFSKNPSKAAVLDLLHRLQLNGVANYYSQHELYTHRRPLHAWVDKTLEDATDVHNGYFAPESVNGKQIVRTLSKWAAARKRYIDVEDRQTSVRPSRSGREATNAGSLRGMTQVERQMQTIPSRLLTLEGQRIQDRLIQIPNTSSRGINRAELAAGCSRRRAGAPVRTSRM